MPFLDDIRQSTTSVEVTHGGVKFTLQCALEKESETNASNCTEGVTYSQLGEQEYTLELKSQLLQQRVAAKLGEFGELEDMESFRKTLELERNAKLSARARKAAEPVSDEEVQAAAEAKIAQFEREIEAIRAEIDTNNEALKLCRAMQIAYLVGGSDIESKPGTPALSNQVNKTPTQLNTDGRIFASFSAVLFEKIRKAVNGAIFGPLVIPTS